ncbi:hypothetical protein RZS08_64120, partial [Arthrospira platensis SPKY1]|nr:hypothetical protein [Arthrospira platensis SPKY1]
MLIEEFTGVRCVQCPAGSADIETYLAIHGEQLIAVSIHAGGFSFPFDESVHDFRTEEGEALNSFLDAVSRGLRQEGTGGLNIIYDALAMDFQYPDP